jgi:predicted DNA binding protein
VTVFVELRVETSAFEYGALLEPPAGVETVVLELAPAESARRAYLWLEDEATRREAFEARVRGDDRTRELLVVDDHASWRLYRLTWESEPTGILGQIADREEALLQASGSVDEWRFKLQFPSYSEVTEFVRTITEADISFTLGEISTGDRLEPRVELTESQHEALVLARANGYFEKSRGVTQEELGEALGITRQAVSYRLRGGIQSLIDATIYGDD